MTLDLAVAEIARKISELELKHPGREVDFRTTLDNPETIIVYYDVIEDCITVERMGET